MTVQYFLDEAVALVVPDCRELRAALTIDTKVMEQDPDKPWKQVVRKRRVAMYNPVEEHGVKGLHVYQGFWDRIQKWCEANGHTFEIYNMRPVFPKPRFDLMHGFRFKQRELLEEALNKDVSGIIRACTRYGKCFGPGTPVMMFDGSIKKVEDIREGELVMGPDSKPRRVTGCVKGWDKMYRIKPLRKGGLEWTCNSAHILHLVRTNTGINKHKERQHENICVADYVNKSKAFKHLRKMRRAPVDWGVRPPPPDFMPAYIYGCWLGDGTEGLISFTKGVSEIWEEIDAWAKKEGLLNTCNYKKSKATTRHYVKNAGTGSTKPGTNHIRMWLRQRKKSQGIRKEYLFGSREIRMELLAGLIDTDGEVNNGMCYAVTSKYEKLAEDIAFLARSLGFDSKIKSSVKHIKSTGFKGTYHRVYINGPVDRIPVRVRSKKVTRQNKFNGLLFGFTVTEEGEGEYYGFELEGPDHLFLLGDTTVVHNTHLMLNICRAFPTLCIVVIIPGADLLKQTLDDFRKELPDRKISAFGAGLQTKFQSKDITICSMDSMHKLDFQNTNLVLVDEPHMLPTNSRLEDFTKFERARRIGVGATVGDTPYGGRFDKRDPLIIGAIGPVLAVKSYKEALAEGAICPIVVLMLKIDVLSLNLGYGDRSKMYKHGFYENEKIREIVKYLSSAVIPPDVQTLIFIQNEKSAEFMREAVPEAEIAMAKLMPKRKDRSAMLQEMKAANLKRCISSNIYATGLTFHDLWAVINCTGGGDSNSGIQKPGRLAEVRPGKKCGFMIDFYFHYPPDSGPDVWKRADACLVRESEQRRQAYAAIEYDLRMVRGPVQLAREVASCL